MEQSTATDRPTLSGVAIRHPSFRSVVVQKAHAEAEIVNATIIAARRTVVGAIRQARVEVEFLSIRSHDRNMRELQAGELAMIWGCDDTSGLNPRWLQRAALNSS